MRKLIAFLVFIIFQFISNIAFAQVSQQWVERFTSDSIRNENVNDMFVDAQGNVYVTGSQRQTGTNTDIQAVTVKYNSQGEQQWIQNYVAPNNNGAFCRAIHVDAAGNVYVTGENAVSSGGSNEMLVIKYSSTGTQLWVNRFQYINGFYTSGFDIITDNTDNVYVTGEYYTGVTFLNNIFLVKFDNDGNLVNQTFYNSNSEGARKIALDGAGKIIVGGYINDNDSSSFIALKYDQNLDFVWAARYGFNVGNQNPIDMVIDNNSNIIISGSSDNDYATVKIDPDGNVLWGKLYNSSLGYDKCRGVVKDDIGNIYVTGETGTSGFPTSYKMTTIKYSPDGDELWVRDYDSTNTVTGYRAYDIAIDNSANTYIIGQTNNLDIVTIKYDSFGSFKWAITYNGPSNSQDIPVSVGVDQNGDVIVTGTSFDDASGYDIATIKYIQSPTSVENETDGPSSFALEQNYPNPFNPTTKIGYTIAPPNLPKGEASVGASLMKPVLLKVYNALGKEVATLVNEQKPAGNYTVEFNASNLSSGIYYYRLETSDFTMTKKMILLR